MLVKVDPVFFLALFGWFWQLLSKNAVSKDKGQGKIFSDSARSTWNAYQNANKYDRILLGHALPTENIEDYIDTWIITLGNVLYFHAAPGPWCHFDLQLNNQVFIG